MTWIEILRASVRPIVTLLFTVAILYGWLFLARLSDDAILGLAGAVIAFWFQGRKTDANGGSPPVAPPEPSPPGSAL